MEMWKHLAVVISFQTKAVDLSVSEGTLYAVGQEELLMILMIVAPIALLGPLLILPALTTYPDTFWKSTLLSLVTVTLSSPLDL